MTKVFCTKLCSWILNILCFPLFTLVESLSYKWKKLNNLKENPEDSSVKAQANEINENIQQNEMKEVIILVIEVSCEASFQIYFQSLLLLPQLYKAFTEAIKSQSFADQPIRYISILTSFVVISRSYLTVSYTHLTLPTKRIV